IVTLYVVIQVPVLSYCYITLINHLFFFQAEDGIRDRNVTGVKTCALPIYPSALYCPRAPAPVPGSRLRDSARQPPGGLWGRNGRSEERRVGKECKCGWWEEH